MAKPRKFNFEKRKSLVNDEDNATLAGIRDGVRDAKAGRTVPAKKVRKFLRTWLAGSSLLNLLTVLGLTPERMLATLPQARKRVIERATASALSQRSPPPPASANSDIPQSNFKIRSRRKSIGKIACLRQAGLCYPSGYKLGCGYATTSALFFVVGLGF